MPLPTALFLTFATGVLAALAGRAEIKLSPRHVLLTQAFTAMLLFVGCVLVPVTVYFYVFHGDWFLCYLLDSTLIPSAVALLGFVLQALIAVAGYSMSASFLRTQREGYSIALGGVAVALALGIPALLRDRLGVVGTYAQFDRTFGLVDLGQSTLLWSVLAMGTILVAGMTYLFARVWMGERR